MKILKTVPIAALALLSLTGSGKVNAQKPNVIFILTDDQGYGDLGCHGNPWLKTPNIDKLYSESVRFTNFHVGTTCAPSRAGLMTGKYCNEVGVWHTINGRELLAKEEVILAGNMKAAGYRTGIFGKWHLGDNYPFRPQDRGFDDVLIHGGGGIGQQPDYWGNDYFDDTYIRNGKPEKFDGYCTDVWFREAMKFIETNKNKQFFCYLPINAPHGPHNVAPEYTRPYENNPSITKPKFYGMIANLDENVGKLRAELNRLGIDKNTILVFMTDNGTAGGGEFDDAEKLTKGYNAGLRGRKGSPYDGGHRVPFFIHWPDGGIFSGKDIGTITSCIDFMPTILDLCAIPTLEGLKFDGLSLKPLITSPNVAWPERILFTDNQRREQLVKWKEFAAMTDRWRLVGKDELYDMSNDPGQEHNVAAKYPQVVEKLIAEYEQWWNKVSVLAESYQYPQIGTNNERLVRLNCHDFHTEKGSPAWSQSMVRAGIGANGFWAVEVMKAATYEIELCRWPKESGLKLNDEAPEGESFPGVDSYSADKNINIVKAGIKIEGQEFQSDVKSDAVSVVFRVKLPVGKTRLESWFIDSQGKERGAYYAYVRKL